MNDTEYTGYAAYSIPVMAYTPQARGFFYKNYNLPDSEIIGRFATVENRSRLKRLRNLCKAKDINPASVMLSYLTSSVNAFNILPVIGASSTAQLRETIGNSGYELTKAEMDYLDGKNDVF